MSTGHKRGRSHVGQRRHPPSSAKALDQPRKRPMQGRSLPSRRVLAFDGAGALGKRAKLNKYLLLLTAANLMIFAAWMFLRSRDGLDADIVLGMVALTLAVWVGLVLTLSRRFAFWLKHERQ